MSQEWRQLDALNFFLADVRGGFGPYLGIFLLTQEHWSPATIGLLATVAGLAGLAFNAPAGAFIDATRYKRAAVVAAVAVLAAGSVAVALWPTFPVVVTSNTLMAVIGDVFGPAVAAITLGLMPAAFFTWRMGRNGAFDHAGNVAIALTAGAVGWWLGQRAVFFLVPLFALAVIASVRAIPAGAIDHARARGVAGRKRDAAPGAPGSRCSLPVDPRWCWPSARPCCISPMRRCCTSSARSWRSPMPARKPRSCRPA